MNAKRPTRAEVDAWIDTLDRAEPHHIRGSWEDAYQRLHGALQRARKIRRYCGIPAVIVAAAFVVLFHGEVWDFNDIENLIVVEIGVLGLAHIALATLFPALGSESRVQTLLRYYGAQDVPHEEEAY